MKKCFEKILGGFNQKRNLFLFITLILLIGLISIGASYAYWRFTYAQNDFNTLGVSCFEVTLTNEENNIQLESAMPITDEEGLLLTPYTFTITNTCNTYAYYGVNLEDINSPSIEKRLSYEYIKASLDGSTPHNLKFYGEAEPTIENADKAFQLTSGTLAPAGSEGDSRTYALRIWMDYNTPALPGTMNASFLSQISIVASYIEQERLENNIVLSYESKTEGYTTESETIEITATSENYNLIEISDDGNTFTSISPTKEIKVTREYTEEGIKKFYVRDEVGNIKEITIELTHLDQSGPEITAIPQEEWGASNTISIELEDLKSGLSGYQITTTEEEPTEWKEASGSSLTIEEVVTENRDYYIWSKDILGNISHQKVTISKIDKNPPIASFNVSTTGGSISIDASASKDNETAIVKYEYKLDNGSYYPSETSSYTFTGASHGSHTVTVRVTDEAGNSSEISQNVEVVILFTITYNANGGSGAPGSQTKTHGVSLTLSSTKPTRTGYTFLGWSKSSTATSASYSAGGMFTENEATTLYAVWKINTYKISYNANGGSGAPGSQTKTYGKTLTLSSTKPTRTGYTFLGWSESSTATSATYSAGGAFTKNVNTTLYAVWRANTYKITYNANGGSGAPSAQSYTYSTSGTINLSSTRPTRTGYTFLGWSQSSTATSASYSAGQAWNRSNASNYTLYAVWRANTYTITYNANGGSGAPAAQSYTYATSGTINLSSAKPTRSGYTFLGWSQSSSATSASYSPGQAWSRSNASNYTLYAVWQSRTGASLSMVNQVFYRNSGTIGKTGNSGYTTNYNTMNSIYFSHNQGTVTVKKAGTYTVYMSIAAASSDESGYSLTFYKNNSAIDKVQTRSNKKSTTFNIDMAIGDTWRIDFTSPNSNKRLHVSVSVNYAS